MTNIEHLIRLAESGSFEPEPETKYWWAWEAWYAYPAVFCLLVIAAVGWACAT